MNIKKAMISLIKQFRLQITLGIIGIVAVLAVLSFMKKWGNFENAFSKWMTRKSWGLYLFHYLPLAICAGLVYQSAMPAVCKYLLTALAAFLGGFLLYEILSRIPFVRWSVCGIRKSREPEKE